MPYQCFSLNGLIQVGSWSELVSVVLPVLAYLGPHIAYRPKAAVKLVRLMALFFEEREKDPTWAQTAHTDSGLWDFFIIFSSQVIFLSKLFGLLFYSVRKVQRTE